MAINTPVVSVDCLHVACIVDPTSPPPCSIIIAHFTQFCDPQEHGKHDGYHCDNYRAND